jgi:Tfp pilus assembly protein PilN
VLWVDPSAVLVRTLEVPTQDRKEIALIVENHAGTVFPLRRSELIVGHRIRPSTSTDGAIVDLYGLPLAHAEAAVTAVQERGFRVETIRLLPQFVEDVPVDPATRPMLVEEQDRWLVRTPGPDGLCRSIDADPSVGRAEMVRRIIEVAERDNRISADSWVVVVQKPLLLDGHDVRLHADADSPLRSLPTARVKTCVDLTPQPLRTTVRQRQQRRAMLFMALLVVLNLVLGSLLLATLLGRARADEAQVRALRQSNSIAVERLQALRDDLRGAHGLQHGRLDQLRAVCLAAPPGVVLSEVMLPRIGPARISGLARSNEALLTYVDSLRAAPEFGLAEVQVAREHAGDDGFAASFELSAWQGGEP